MINCFFVKRGKDKQLSTKLPNLFQLFSLSAKKIRSIRSIVPQELVLKKTYPFGMIKLIQRIYRTYYFQPRIKCEFHELGEPWRLLGNHPDGAFAKKAINSFNS